MRRCLQLGYRLHFAAFANNVLVSMDHCTRSQAGTETETNTFQVRLEQYLVSSTFEWNDQRDDQVDIVGSGDSQITA